MPAERLDFMMPGGDQSAQHTPRLRRPDYRAFIDMPVPRSCMVASGRKSECERKHCLFLIAFVVGIGRLGRRFLVALLCFARAGVGHGCDFKTSVCLRGFNQTGKRGLELTP